MRQGIIQSSKMFLVANRLEGKKVESSIRYLSDMEAVFMDKVAFSALDPQQPVYEVDCYFPVADNKSGGLFFGLTRIFPGKVGGEFFMTKGHFHSNNDTAEFYWGIKGKGLLLFMDKTRKVWAEEMTEGSVHYIPGNTAHRVINTGVEMLSFGACWPSDAGHDYGSIEKEGFSARVVEKDGKLIIIEE
ncbi:cupin domain-containing protein [Maribellus luteus]|uniref:glucose-6-phosphate isomerase n=1 Tax=Maribellus luteus TaxID=2305463 RepID=A0A399T9H9_9BACT|nr:glucose-6-phosphate isomerase family protein [Maribellus luteus]RIJ50821.1 cupin domain-containing protein [Maribellus luteus]